MRRLNRPLRQALYPAMIRFLRLTFALFIVAAATPAWGQQASGHDGGSLTSMAQVSSRAAALFERDWVLANWALKKFDGDRDILLSSRESAAAAAEFRKIADSNGDGRVTPPEYRAARDFILARY